MVNEEARQLVVIFNVEQIAVDRAAGQRGQPFAFVLKISTRENRSGWSKELRCI
jgi:hypothetical protein